MDLFTAMIERHSVRSYTTQPITDPVKSQLQTFLKQCNQESGLHRHLMDCLLTMGILKMYEIILHWSEKRVTSCRNNADITAKN